MSWTSIGIGLMIVIGSILCVYVGALIWNG